MCCAPSCRLCRHRTGRWLRGLQQAGRAGAPRWTGNLGGLLGPRAAQVLRTAHRWALGYCYSHCRADGQSVGGREPHSRPGSGRAPFRSTGPIHTDRRRTLQPLAGRTGSHPWQIQTGRGDPLCHRPAPIARTLPRRRTHRDRLQHRRTCHPASNNVGFIVPLIFKCLETLAVDGRDHRDAGDPFDQR